MHWNCNNVINSATKPPNRGLPHAWKVSWAFAERIQNSWDSGFLSFQFSSVQLLSRVQLFATPWIPARQASLSITNSWSLLKPMSIESVMASSHLILCCPLLLLPPIPPSIRVFSNEWTLRMRWPKYWSFSFKCTQFLNDYFAIRFICSGWDSKKMKLLSRCC